MKITLVELPATLNGKLFEGPAEDIYSAFYLPARAIDLLRGILEEKGYQDVQTITPRFNKKPEIITEDQLNRLYESDVVGISAITRTIPQSYELADLIREKNSKAWIIFGGPHVTAIPEEALSHGDYVVRNEGEAAFPELIGKISENFNAPDTADIKGISYLSPDGRVINNPKREFLTPEEFSNQPFPVYSEEVIEKSNAFTINTSRGCPYNCEFCSVVANFGNKYRTMDVDRTISLIKYIIALKKNSRKYSIFFGDDNFTADKKRTKTLLRRIIDEKIPLPPWSAQVRVESANDAELLGLMKQAGCFYVFIGFESINEDTLKLWHKHSNLFKIRKAITNYHNAGISIHGMFVFGSKFDTPDTVEHTIDFAIKNNIDTIQLFAITPLPGTALTRRYIREKRILCTMWHLYSAQLVLTKPEQMSSFKLQEAIKRGYSRFYNFRRVMKKFLFHSRRKEIINSIIGVYLWSKIRKNMNGYLKALHNLDIMNNVLNNSFSRWLKGIKEWCAHLEGGIKENREVIFNKFIQYKENISKLYSHYARKSKKYADVINTGFKDINRNITGWFKRELSKLDKGRF